jgi:hypothetical protein
MATFTFGVIPVPVVKARDTVLIQYRLAIILKSILPLGNLYLENRRNLRC